MFGKALLLSLLTTFAPPASQPLGGGHEQLQGFGTVLVNQINAAFGTENLPPGMGLPVEPGLYVTIAPQRALIFDKVAATISGGQFVDQTVAAECVSKCPRSIFDAFHNNWRDLAQEGAALGLDVPSRVLFAADKSVSGKVLVQTAYAAAETRPGTLPNLYMVLNGGQAGVRARRFHLLPPRGLAVPPGQRVLGLTIKVEAGARYTITAADPRFQRTLQANAGTLGATLADIKKNYPGKETIIIVPGDSATVGDMVGLMVAAQAHFTRVVFSGGQRVVVG